jgi:hypothetical protein
MFLQLMRTTVLPRKSVDFLHTLLLSVSVADDEVSSHLIPPPEQHCVSSCFLLHASCIQMFLAGL